jgi:hypothetical protein
MFCAGKYQSDYFPLAVGFFAAGALVAFAAPAFALVDLAAPVFAFVDFGAAGLAAAVALVDFAAVLFAAISIFLHEEICGTGEVCRMSAGARHEQPRVLNRLRWGQTRPTSSNLSRVIKDFRQVRQAEIVLHQRLPDNCNSLSVRYSRSTDLSLCLGAIITDS